MENKPLTDYEKMKVFTLINLYELVISFIMGIILNEISYYLFPVNVKNNILVIILLTIVLGIIIINCVLYLRMKVKFFPGVLEYSQRKGFTHPPPIALTFGFWMTQHQLRVRKSLIKKFVYKLINSPSVNYKI